MIYKTLQSKTTNVTLRAACQRVALKYGSRNHGRNASTTSSNSARCQIYYGMQNPPFVEPPTSHSSDIRIEYAAVHVKHFVVVHSGALKFGPLLYVAGMHKYISGNIINKHIAVNVICSGSALYMAV